MIVGIHQSQYLPWPPYFRKIALSEIFVVLDDVQFQKNGLQNRNKVRNKNGDYWLTIPATGNMKDTIKEKLTANIKWRKKHFLSIQQSYSRAPFWDKYENDLQAIFQKHSIHIHEINTDFLEFFLDIFDLKTKIIMSSDLDVSGSKSDLVLNICMKLNATQYLSGEGGMDYLNTEKFSDAGVEIKLLSSLAPTYTQFNGEFISNLSMLDMLMNMDKDVIVHNFLKEKIN